MRDGGAGFMAARQFAFGQVDAMPVDGPRSEQAVMPIDIKIAAALGIQRLCLGYLAEVFGYMRLQVGIGVFLP